MKCYEHTNTQYEDGQGTVPENCGWGGTLAPEARG